MMSPARNCVWTQSLNFVPNLLLLTDELGEPVSTVNFKWRMADFLRLLEQAATIINSVQGHYLG